MKALNIVLLGILAIYLGPSFRVLAMPGLWSEAVWTQLLITGVMLVPCGVITPPAGPFRGGMP